MPNQASGTCFSIELRVLSQLFNEDDFLGKIYRAFRNGQLALPKPRKKFDLLVSGYFQARGNPGIFKPSGKSLLPY